MNLSERPVVNERLLVALAVARKGGTPSYRIAAEAGIHPSELSRWAYGHQTPSLEQARRVASVLDQPAAVLFLDLEEALTKNEASGANADLVKLGDGAADHATG